MRKHGYIIVKRNYRDRFGEIDLIAENRSFLVFVEVKTRTQNALFSGREAVDSHKQKRIIATARGFAKRLHLDLQMRFDVCEITILDEQDNHWKYHLNYIPSAF